jgi:hypothetical protein
LVFFLSNLGDVSNLGDCGECAGQNYGWSILGNVIGTVIILIIAKIKSMFLNIDP